jgi:hypothetical protein
MLTYVMLTHDLLLSQSGHGPGAFSLLDDVLRNPDAWIPAVGAAMPEVLGELELVLTWAYPQLDNG